MAWTFEDKFNSDTKSLGDLNTQDGWSGAVEFDVQNTEKFEGDQAVECLSELKNIKSPTGLGETSGVMYVAMKPKTLPTSGSEFRTYLRDDANNGMWNLTFRNNGGVLQLQMTHTNSNTRVTLESPAELNKWYVIAIEIDKDHGGAGDHRARVKGGKEGGSWSSWFDNGGDWYPDLGASDGTVDYIWLMTEVNASGYWDCITPTDPTAEATTTSTTTSTTSTTSSTTSSTASTTTSATSTTSTTSSTSSSTSSSTTSTTSSTTTSATSTTSTTTSSSTSSTSSTTSTTTSATSTTSTSTSTSTTSTATSTTSTTTTGAGTQTSTTSSTSTSTSSSTSSTSSTTSSTTSTSTSSSTSSTSSSTSSTTSSTITAPPYLVAEMDVQDFKPILNVNNKL